MTRVPVDPEKSTSNATGSSRSRRLSPALTDAVRYTPPRPEDLLNALMILQERIKAQGIMPRQ